MLFQDIIDLIDDTPHDTGTCIQFTKDIGRDKSLIASRNHDWFLFFNDYNDLMFDITERHMSWTERKGPHEPTLGFEDFTDSDWNIVDNIPGVSFREDRLLFGDIADNYEITFDKLFIATLNSNESLYYCNVMDVLMRLWSNNRALYNAAELAIRYTLMELAYVDHNKYHFDDDIYDTTIAMVETLCHNPTLYSQDKMPAH